MDVLEEVLREKNKFRQEALSWQFVAGYLWGALEWHVGAKEAKRIVKEAKAKAKEKLG